MNQPTVSLIVGNNSTTIEGIEPGGAIYDIIKKSIRYKPEDAAFRIYSQRGKTNGKWQWDGYVNLICRGKQWCKCPIKKEGMHFPTGLYSKVVQALKDYGLKYQTIDNRQKYEPNFSMEMSKNFEERDYHLDTVDKAVPATRGIIQAATGSGKTPMSAYLIKRLGVTPFVFYVPSIDLLKQTQDELSRFLRHKGKKIPIGAIGGGMFDPQEINVMTIQTAVRACGEHYTKFDDEDDTDEDDTLDSKKREIQSIIMGAKGIIADEVQHWAAETCQTISDYSVSALYKYGVSATPFRDKGDDILIDACFGKTIANINASFLIKKGYLVKPTINFIKIAHRTLNGMTYSTIYKNHIVENVERNGIIAHLATNMADEGANILILVRQISHGQILEKLIPDSVFLHGSHTGKQRKKHIDKVRKEKAFITIATSIFDEGIDIRPLDTLILAGSGKSQTRALQRIGRILRPYTSPNGKVKDSATVIDFNDPYKYLKAHSNKRRAIYETEPEFVIEDLSV